MPLREMPVQSGRFGYTSAIPAFLCLAMFFISRNLFSCQLLLDPGLLAPGLGQAAGHYLLTILFSVPLCFYLRKPEKSPLARRIAAACPLVAGCVATLGYFNQAGSIGLYVPPVLLGACFALLFPFAISLFFASLPARRIGVCFGLAMAAGEFVWLLALPPISAQGLDAASAHPFVTHLRAMQGLVHCGMGVLLAYLVATVPGKCFAGAGPTENGTEQALPGEGQAPDFTGHSHALIPDQTSGSPAHSASPFAETAQAARQKLFFLVGLFCASGLLLFLFGIGLGTAFPKASHRPALAEPLHYFMIACLPLAGWLLDKGRSGCGVLLVWILLCAFSVPLEMLRGALGPNGELTPLLFMGRETLLLCLFSHTLILSRQPLIPLAGSMAYSMYLVAFAGGLFAGSASFAVQETLATPAMAFGLATAFAVIAIGLFLRSMRCPALWSRELPGMLPDPPATRTPEQGTTILTESIYASPLTPEKKTGPEANKPGDACPEAGKPETAAARPDTAVPDAARQEAPKLSAFAVAFGLSNREFQVLEGIIKDFPPESIAASLGVRESTVRFHQTGLFKKTGQPNRRLLALFFQTWNPE